MQRLGQTGRVEHRAVVLLVGLELFAVSIQTEGFAHQPVSALGILLAQWVVWLVAQAADSLTVGQQGGEAKLALFGGMDVEALQAQVAHFKAVSIFQNMHHHKITNTFCFL